MDAAPAPPVFATAGEVCAHLPMGAAALKLLQPDATPDAFLNVLVEKHLYVDAIRYLGLFLPARKAVWWACACLHHAGGEMRPAERAALAAAVRWVLQPGDERTQTAKAALRDAGPDTAAGAIALAASKAVKSPVAASKAAAGAVLMAGAGVKGETLAQAYGGFVDLGLTVNRLSAPWHVAPSELHA